MQPYLDHLLERTAWIAEILGVIISLILFHWEWQAQRRKRQYEASRERFERPGWQQESWQGQWQPQTEYRGSATGYGAYREEYVSNSKWTWRDSVSYFFTLTVLGRVLTAILAMVVVGLLSAPAYAWGWPWGVLIGVANGCLVATYYVVVLEAGQEGCIYFPFVVFLTYILQLVAGNVWAWLISRAIVAWNDWSG